MVVSSSTSRPSTTSTSTSTTASTSTSTTPSTTEASSTTSSTTSTSSTTPTSSTAESTPSSSTTAAAEQARREHVVKPGETLSGIAAKHQTTTEELAKRNKIANPDLIHPGQRISLPERRKAAAPSDGVDSPAFARRRTDAKLSVGDTSGTRAPAACVDTNHPRIGVDDVVGDNTSSRSMKVKRGIDPAKGDAPKTGPATQEYRELAKDDDTKAAMDQAGIKNGGDLRRLGDDLANGKARDFSNVDDKEALAKVIQGAGETQEGDAKKTLRDPSYATMVANGTDPKAAEKAAPKLKDLGVSPGDIADIARAGKPEQAQKTFDALTKLADGDASGADKVAAALELGEQARDLIPPEKLDNVIGRGLGELDKAGNVASSIATLTDPDASDVSKANAALKLANEAKDIPGMVLPELGEKLNKLDGPAKLAGAAMTLVDPDADLKDKAVAGAELVAGLPDLKGDITKLRDAFRKNGVQNADDVIRRGDDLAQLAAEGIPPSKAADFSRQQIDQLKELGAKTEGKSLGELVGKVDDPAQLDKLVSDLNGLDSVSAKNAVNALNGVDASTLNRTLADPKLGEDLVGVASKLSDEGVANLGQALDGLDKKGTSQFLEVAKGMKPDDLSKVLDNADDAKAFGKTVSALSPGNVADFAKAARDMDPGALKFISKLGQNAPSDVVNKLAPVIGKLASNDLVGKSIGALGKLMDVMKLPITADVATKALKGLTKMLPAIGAGVAAYDTGRFAVEAAKMQGKQDDLAFLAHTGVKINALDTALNLIPGVGDIAGIATGVGALALDLGYSHEKAKWEANPDGYKAPDWMKAVNIGAAVAGGPAGVAELVATYGPKDAGELGLWAMGKGGDLAKAAWDVIKDVGGPALEYAMKGVEALKDLGAAGAEALEYIATAPGELGAEVAEAAVNGLKDLKEAGVESLKAVAAAGGEAAEFAVNGLKDLAGAGIGAAEDALGALEDLGGFVGGLAGDALGGLKDLVGAVTPW